ncbi:MAG: TraG/VirB4 family ATPase [Candidatus Eiseniibacteriota bacterium]
MTAARWSWERIEVLKADDPPLADLLPWRWVEQEHVPIHVLADGSLGLAWELSMADVELLDSGAAESAHRAIQHFLHQVPTSAAFQVLLLQWPTIDAALTTWKALRRASSLTSRIVAARERHYRALVDDDFFTAKTLQVVLTLRWWPAGSRRRGWRRRLRGFAPLDALKIARDDRREAILQMSRLSEHVNVLARTIGAEATPIDGPRMLEILWRLLNPGSSQGPPAWDRRRPMNHQVVESGAVFRPDGFALGPLEGRVISMLGLPPETRPGHFTLSPEPGTPSALIRRPGLGWTTLAGTVLDPESARSWVNRKRFFAFSQRLGLMGDQRVEAERIHEELGVLTDQAFSAGLRLCRTAFHFVLLERAERIQHRTEHLLSALAQLQCRASVEQAITLMSLIESLPFGYDPQLEANSRRARTLLSRNLADLVPLYGGYAGTRTPVQIFLGRTGAPIFFDPFDSSVGMHVAVSGVTGSGKSFTAIDMILQQLSLGADVVVLDKGDSYRRLSELVGGQYLAVDPNNVVTLNPCFGPGDADHQMFVANVLAEMASGGQERFRLDPEQFGVLTSAVAEAFASTDSQEITIADIVQLLKHPEHDVDRLGLRLARMVAPYLRGNPLGRYFDGPNALVIRPGLTVIELKELERTPSLQAVFVMALLHLVTTFFGRAPREHRKFIFVDEAWAILKSEYGANILALIARTYRKLGTAAVFISQFLTDFDGPAGQAIRDNCPNRIFLRQELDALKRMKEPLGFGEQHLQALASATNVPGRYSEAMLVTPGGRCMVRIIPDPVTYGVATTHPADTGRWNVAVVESGGRVDAALDRLLAANVQGGTSP